MNPINLNSHLIQVRKSSHTDQDVLLEGAVRWWDGREISVKKGILRFVQSESYARSFGFQWKHFSTTQLDSKSEVKISQDRAQTCTKWMPEELQGKNLLEAGCGAGRFTEAFLKTGACVFSFDLSTAVEVAYDNNAPKRNVIFAQADILNIPTPPSHFDYVFCYGVLQHVKSPEAAFLELTRQLKSGGKISVYVYYKDGKIKPWKAKYLWRWLTVQIPDPILYAMVSLYVPLWLPIDLVLRRVPVVGIYLASIVPCFNWFNIKKPSWEGVRRTILDTFDALSAHYDFPQNVDDLKSWAGKANLINVDIFEGANGLVLNAQKR